VVGRKEGTSVYYSVADPLIFDILDAARELFNNHVTHARAMLDEEEEALAGTASVG
jgi:ArsR family transcriptional regulator